MMEMDKDKFSNVSTIYFIDKMWGDDARGIFIGCHLGLEDIKHHFKHKFNIKCMSYDEQYLNEDGDERDRPKDMDNEYILTLDKECDKVAYLTIDPLYCGKFPSQVEVS